MKKILYTHLSIIYLTTKLHIERTKMNRSIALLLCIILASHPVLAADFVGEVAEEAIDTSGETAMETDEIIEGWESNEEVQDDWDK